MKKLVQFYVCAGLAEAEPFEVEPKVSELPTEFAFAKQHWETHQDIAIGAIHKFLKCSFDPSNVFADLSEVVLNPAQMEAVEVDLLWVDYSNDTLPVVTAEATFEMSFVEGLTAEALDKWQVKHDSLDNGFSFYWDLHKEKVGKYFFLWTNSVCSVEVNL